MAVFAGLIFTGNAVSGSIADREQGVDERVEKILGQMTIEEKISLCHADSKFSVVAVERLGVPSICMSDGPHGVREECSKNSWAPAGLTTDYATYLPTGTALAATWNPDMAKKHGTVLGSEARHRKKDIILGPGINIIRTPVCGRNFEYYSEDPYLISKIVVPEIKAIQEQDVSACVKHYALNNQELNRGGVSVEVDKRTLREIYLPGFEAAVKEGGVLTVMGAYNSFRGQNCCQNRYLVQEVLKDEWKFKGVLITDWGANIDTLNAARNGTDIEMGTGANYDNYYLARPFLKAIDDGKVPESALDDKVRRILRVMILSGMMDSGRKEGERNTEGHRKMAREIAEEAVVLLKNDGILPLDINKVRNILVVGENANAQHAREGGSSYVKTSYEITPLEGLESRAGARLNIDFIKVSTEEAGLPPIGAGFLTTMDPVSGIKAWKGEYFSGKELKGIPREIKYDTSVNFDWHSGCPLATMPPDNFSVRWTGKIKAPETGTYTFSLGSDDGSRFYIDDKCLISNWNDHAYEVKKARIKLEAGKEYALRVEYYEGGQAAAVGLGWKVPEKGGESRYSGIAKIAGKADAVIVFAGLNHKYDTEGRDRPDMKLPSGQDDLIEELASANPKTIVFLIGGSPVEMPWIDKVPAVVQAWYLGMEGGNVMADVIFGDVNPSGKLPFTFPKKLEDSPAHAIGDYLPGRCEYKEGILIGYRWYDTKNIEPLFPFGHGLSYTTFKYGNLKINKGSGDVAATAALDITNTGNRAGAEVVQLYIQDPECSVERPAKELKGFEKVSLKPGETKTVEFKLTKRALSFYDIKSKSWVAEPGTFNVLVGSSSRDIRQEGSFEL
ncbi:MAG: glycoside hydrolase family 3 C-terminal domain-containing protein [Candidatus Aureabacteria bacterium]|nr:glycoside hydrolase family 3 C-terminal domain-containing protein [Candidatus Auribacterota bacterium]